MENGMTHTKNYALFALEAKRRIPFQVYSQSA